MSLSLCLPSLIPEILTKLNLGVVFSQLSSNEDEDVLATFTGPKVQQVSIADIAVEARYISAGEDEDEDDGWGTASDSVADLTLGEADAQFVFPPFPFDFDTSVLTPISG